jgi:hypothetical protein
MDLAESLQVFYGGWFGGLFHWVLPF